MKGQDACCGPCAGGIYRSFSIWIRNVHNVPRKDGFLLDNINYYQKHIDPQLKRELDVKKICSFIPTCSNYSKQAVKKYGSLGFFIGAFRILRCNPITGGGKDPI